MPSPVALRALTTAKYDDNNQEGDNINSSNSNSNNPPSLAAIMDDSILYGALYPSVPQGSSSPARSSSTSASSASSIVGCVTKRSNPMQQQEEEEAKTVPQRYYDFQSSDKQEPSTPNTTDSRSRSRSTKKKSKQKSQPKSSEPALCHLLWTRQWEAVQERLKRVNPCSNNTMEIQRYTKLKCFSNGAKGLPLHLACAMRPLPPAGIVEALLEAYPVATSQKASMWGLLPLHLAVDLRGESKRSSSMHGLKKHRKSAEESSRDAMDSTATMWSTTDNSSVNNSVPTYTSTSVNSSAASSPTSSVSSPSSPESNRHVTRSTAADDDTDYDSDSDNDDVDADDARLLKNDHCKIVHLLLEEYPEALNVKEEFHGMLPLHIAASSTPTTNGKVPASAAFIMLRLLEKAPETLRSKDDEGETPMALARRANHTHDFVSNNGSNNVHDHHHTHKNTGCTMVSPLPDWKWNPILYPPSRRQSYPLNMASLLVGSMDDLLNMSSSSSSNDDRGGEESSSSYFSSSEDSDAEHGSGSVDTPVNVTDNDDMDEEWERLGVYERALQRELEDSIRIHCGSSSHFFLEDTNWIASAEKEQGNDDPLQDEIESPSEKYVDDDYIKVVKEVDDKDLELEIDMSIGTTDFDDEIPPVSNHEDDGEGVESEMDMSIGTKEFEDDTPSITAECSPILLQKENGFPKVNLSLALEPTLEEAVAMADRVVAESVDGIYCIGCSDSTRTRSSDAYDDDSCDDDLSEEMERLSSFEESLRQDLESATSCAPFSQHSSARFMEEELLGGSLDDENDEDQHSSFGSLTRVEPTLSLSLEDVSWDVPLLCLESSRGQALSSSLGSTLTGTASTPNIAYLWDEVPLDEDITPNGIEEEFHRDTEAVKETMLDLPRREARCSQKNRVFIGSRELPSFLWGLPSIQESYSMDSDVTHFVPTTGFSLPLTRTTKIAKTEDERSKRQEIVDSEENTEESSHDDVKVSLIYWERGTKTTASRLTRRAIGGISVEPAQKNSTRKVPNLHETNVPLILWQRMPRRAASSLKISGAPGQAQSNEDVEVSYGAIRSPENDATLSSLSDLEGKESITKEPRIIYWERTNNIPDKDTHNQDSIPRFDTAQKRPVEPVEINWVRMPIERSGPEYVEYCCNQSVEKELLGTQLQSTVPEVKCAVEEPSSDAQPFSPCNLSSPLDDSDLTREETSCPGGSGTGSAVEASSISKSAESQESTGAWDSETSNQSDKSWLEGAALTTEEKQQRQGCRPVNVPMDKSETETSSSLETCAEVVQGDEMEHRTATDGFLDAIPYVTDQDNSEANSEMTSLDLDNKRTAYLPRPPTSALTELTQQLQRLKEENESKAHEMERLKLRVSIMTEIKGVSATELRNALQAICEKEGNTTAASSSVHNDSQSSSEMTDNATNSTESALPIGEVLDHWYQELNAEELKQAPQKKTKMPETDEPTYCSTPSLSPPRIIKTSDGIENWSIDEDDASYWKKSGDATSSMSLQEKSLTGLAQDLIGADPQESFNEWCDELLEETVCSEAQCGIQPVRSTAENKVDAKITAMPVSPKEDDSDDSVVGLEIREDSRELDSRKVKYNHRDHRAITEKRKRYNRRDHLRAIIDKRKRYNRRDHLRAIIDKRKRAGCFLSSDTALEGLLKSRPLSNYDRAKPDFLNHQEFDCIWERASSCYTENFDSREIGLQPRHMPTHPPPPPAVRNPYLKYTTEPFRQYILSSTMEDTIGELLEEEGQCVSETLQPEDGQRPESKRHVKISVLETVDSMGSCDENRTPEESSGCLGENLADVWHGENLKDTTCACIERLAEAHRSISSKLFRPLDSKDKEDLTGQRSSEDEIHVSPGLVGFVDQLASDLDKTISSLSQYIQSPSMCYPSTKEDRGEVVVRGALQEEEKIITKTVLSTTTRRKKKGKKSTGGYTKNYCGLRVHRRSIYL